MNDAHYLSREEQVESLRNAAAVLDVLLQDGRRVSRALRGDLMDGRDICRATADALERSRSCPCVMRGGAR